MAADFTVQYMIQTGANTCWRPNFCLLASLLQSIINCLQNKDKFSLELLFFSFWKHEKQQQKPY